MNLLGEARRLGAFLLVLIFLSCGNACKQGIPVSIAILLQMTVCIKFWELDLILSETQLLPIKLTKKGTGQRLSRQVKTFPILLRYFSERDQSAYTVLSALGRSPKGTSTCTVDSQYLCI